MPKAKYLKEGSYVRGVPSRDLSAEEWGDLTQELRERAVWSGTFKEVGPKNAHLVGDPPSDPEPDEDGAGPDVEPDLGSGGSDEDGE